MRRWLVLVPVLLLNGCGDLYYQTRYIPTSVDSTYAASEQVTWSGDKQVYELPANPPAIDSLHRPRKDCKPPGQKFKSQAVLGIGNEVHHQESGEIDPIARYDDGPFPGSAEGPMKAYPVGVYGDPVQTGAREPVGLIPIGVSEHGPYPFRGSGTDVTPASQVATYRDDQTNWCTGP